MLNLKSIENIKYFKILEKFLKQGLPTFCTVAERLTSATAVKKVHAGHAPGTSERCGMFVTPRVCLFNR